MDEQTNDVWSTLKGFSGDILGAARDVAVARIRTRSAPSGSGGAAAWNPAPGTQGAYPQAEGKPSLGAFGFNASMLPALLIAAGAVLLVLALARR